MHRSKKRRNVIIFSLVGILLCMVVGYAAFQTRLEISGSSTVTSNWDIEITNVTDGEASGSAENATKPSWKATSASMEANLYDKGDAMEYDVTIENKGTIDAKLNDILTNLEQENSDAVIITFSGYTKGEVLKAKESKIVHVKIEYNPDYEGGETSSEVTIDFEYTQNNNETENPNDKYLVTYNCTENGGEDCSANNEYIVSGSNVNLNKVGNKDGFQFIGWNTNKNSEEKLDSLVMAENDITLYAIFKDITSPTCTLKVTSATIDTVTVEANCEDASGISKYEYAMNNSGYTDNKTSKSYTFDSFDLSTIKLRATDGAGNQGEFTLDTSALESGYQIIYNALNKEYENILEDKETYEDEFLDKTYPVGSIYITTNNTNPSNTLGGTWERYAEGRTLLGVGSNDTDNYTTSGLTGGTENVTLATLNLSSHTHSATPLGTVISTFTGKSATTSTNGEHTHSVEYIPARESQEETCVGSCAAKVGLLPNGWPFRDRVIVETYTRSTELNATGNHTHSFTANGTVTSKFTGSNVTTSQIGGSQSFNVMNPYIVTYIWRRTG